jgi:hypothetical protein
MGADMKKMILLLTIFVFVGCAGNAAMIKKEMAANPIADAKGRIVVYRPVDFFGSAIKIDILVDGETITELANESIFYKDVNADGYDVELGKRFGGEVLKVKVQNAEIVYVKIYASTRTKFGGPWNIEQIKPKRAINEIKALGESEAGHLNDPETH